MRTGNSIGSRHQFQPRIKFDDIFTLEARIACDKHRNEFLQTHRRTFICRGPTLGFTPTSHSARRRIGAHLYWRRFLYYLFVCECRIRSGSFDFFQFGNNAEGDVLRAVARLAAISRAARSLVAGAGERAAWLTRARTWDLSTRRH